MLLFSKYIQCNGLHYVHLSNTISVLSQKQQQQQQQQKKYINIVHFFNLTGRVARILIMVTVHNGLQS